jgi:glycosyltransferase involved in cell wall biosynthesis
VRACAEEPSQRHAKRVAVYLPSLAGGGAERTFLVLASGFARRGWDVDLVVADPTGPLLGEVSPAVRLIGLGAANVTMSIVPFARYLRRRRPDAVLTAMSHANLAAVLAISISRVPTRLVVTEHQHLSTLLAGSATRRERLFPGLMRALYPRAAEVVAVSAGVADDLALRAQIPRSSIRVEKNPIRIEELRALGAEPPRHEWFDAGEPPVVLGVGRLTRQKDFGTLVRAFRRLRDSRAARLLLLGDGEDRQLLERLVAELDLRGDVRIMGFVSNPYPYYAGADLFVLSSLWEGLPTVLLEAMVFGLPIVSTDCHSGPEEILEGGRLGALVRPGDPVALAQAMTAALAPRGEQTRRQYDNLCEYDVERVVDRYSELLGS